MNSKNDRQVQIAGVVYKSQSAAARAIGKSQPAISRAIQQGRIQKIIPKRSDYKYIDTRDNPVTVRGDYFKSQAAAAKHFGVHTSVVATLLANGRIDMLGLGSGNHGNNSLKSKSIPVTLYGVTYPSVRAACRALSIDRNAMRKALKKANSLS